MDGQIALHLARQVKAATGSSAANLAKELRVVIDRATGAEAKLPGEPTPAPVEDDEVTRARQVRERKARQAAAR